MRDYKSIEQIAELSTPELIKYHKYLKDVIASIRKDINDLGLVYKETRIELKIRIKANEMTMKQIENKRLSSDELPSLEELINLDLQ